jgi:hypothetical protein
MPIDGKIDNLLSIVEVILHALQQVKGIDKAIPVSII